MSEREHDAAALRRMMDAVAKMPEFNPTWDPILQELWFDGYAALAETIRRVNDKEEVRRSAAVIHPPHHPTNR